MSGGSGTYVDDEDDFFDQPLSRQGTTKKPAAEQRLSASGPSAEDGAGNASRSSYQQRDLHRSSSDDSNSDHSSGGKRASVKECDRRTGTSSAKGRSVVIQLPSETQQGEERAPDSSAAEGGSADHKDSFREQQPPRQTKNKKAIDEHKARAAGLEHENRGKKGSMSSYSRSDYSSDEEKRQLESRHSSRSASSTSASYNSQHVGTYENSRSTSAPARRPQQLRPVRGFGNQSRMEVKALLESLLEVENPRARRKSAAKPVEYRRRLNYTFSDQRLEMIERENKRLLENLIKIHYSEPTYDWKPTTHPVKLATFPDAARIKQLEKIQKENLV